MHSHAPTHAQGATLTGIAVLETVVKLCASVAFTQL